MNIAPISVPNTMMPAQAATQKIRRLATFSPEVEEERRGAKEFLYQNLYFSAALDPEKNDAERVIRELFEFWMASPASLPSSYQEKAEQEPLPRVVCDYIAGMTDRYLMEEYARLGN